MHAVTLIAGLALGSAWYVLMFVIHGPVAIDLFLADQVGARITPDLVRPLIQFPVVLAVFAALLLPWSLPLLEIVLRDRSALAGAGAPQHGSRSFLVLWVLVVALMVSLVTHASTRYMLLGSPMWSVLLADVLVRARREIMDRWFGGMTWFLIAALVAFGR